MCVEFILTLMNVCWSNHHATREETDNFIRKLRIQPVTVFSHCGSGSETMKCAFLVMSKAPQPTAIEHTPRLCLKQEMFYGTCLP